MAPSRRSSLPSTTTAVDSRAMRRLRCQTLGGQMTLTMPVSSSMFMKTMPPVVGGVGGG